MWDLTPWPVVEPVPLHWKQGVLTTGPPGKSLFLFYFVRKWENLTVLLKSSRKFCQINYFWNREYKITTTIILQVNPSSLDHSCMYSIQSPLDAPSHWQKTRVEIRQAWSYVCMSSHTGRLLWWGSVPTFLKEKEETGREWRRNEWREGKRKRKISHAWQCIDYLAFMKKKTYVIWWFSLVCSVSFSCYIISSQVWIKYTNSLFLYLLAYFVRVKDTGGSSTDKKARIL